MDSGNKLLRTPEPNTMFLVLPLPPRPPKHMTTIMKTANEINGSEWSRLIRMFSVTTNRTVDPLTLSAEYFF